MSIENAIVRIANNIDRNLGWHAVTHFHQAKVLTDKQFKMLGDFERLEHADYELTNLQRHARREINKQVINSFSALDLFGLGIDVHDLGWQHEYILVI